MIYIKSLIAGILSSVIATILFVLVMAIYIASTYKRKEGEGIGWDVIAFARSLIGRVIIVVSFLAGFIWEFRR